MSDDVAQVLKMEMDGVIYAVKASVMTAQFVMNLLKSVVSYSRDKVLNHPGEHKMKSIYKISEGDPGVINCPEKYFSEFLDTLKKEGVPFHVLADLNASDGKSPVLIPKQFLAVASAHVKKYIEDQIPESEKQLNNIVEQINEKKEKLLHASPVERSVLNREIEHLETSKSEIEDILGGFKSDAEKDDLSMSFSEYLATGKGTTVEQDPSGVIESMKVGGKSSPKFDAKEILKPVRSPYSMPDSKLHFICPENGSTLTRQFDVDDNGIVFSTYTFKDKENNEIKTFSDRYVTTDEWYNGSVKNSNFKDLLTETGILEGTLCECYDTEAGLKAALVRFQAYSEKYAELSEKNQNREVDATFSNADVEDEVKYAASQNDRGRASADIAANNLTFDIPKDKIFEKDGVVNVIVDDDTVLKFKDVDLLSVDDNFTKFRVKGTSDIVYEDKKSSRNINISAKEGMEMYNKVNSDVSAEVLDNVADKGLGR